jgi:hypothetical protein
VARRGGHDARRALPVGEVGCAAGAETAGLGGRVDGHEDDVGIGDDVAVDVGAEGEVAGLRPRHSLTTASRPGSRTGRRSLFQASMRGRETSTTATSMAGHSALECHHGHRRAADEAGADAADLHHGVCLHFTCLLLCSLCNQCRKED